MMDVGRHPRIQLFTHSEVETVTGFVGNFHVTVRKKARYVDETACNACNECVAVCPVAVPDAYQQGFSSRKAIYMPFPQAVPSSYIIDMDACLGNNPIACGKCADVCEKHCIDYDAKDEIVPLEVGAVIVATGVDVYDPTEYDEYGYTRYENVITSMEFERLICAGGPTAGHFVRPSDEQRPLRVGFIQCVGSRSLSPKGNPYCSNICCMNTVKDTLLLADHYPDVESTVYYMDIRAFGKGFEDLYRRSKEAGVRYLRGLPGHVREDPASRNLVVTVEDTNTGRRLEEEQDLIVLACGVIPRQNGGNVKHLLNLSQTADGFFMESHPKLKPVDAPSRGVFFAGCAEFPKDVKDSVTQAGAAASRAGILLSTGKVTIEAITPVIDTEFCTQCGICAKVCPYGAIRPPDARTGRYPEVIEAACSGCGTCAAECPMDVIAMRHFNDAQILGQIDALLEDHPEEKVLAFACNWCSYPGADLAGTNRSQYPAHARLVRTMCSGRVDEDFILHALMRGAAMVLVSGCHFADCHYINAVTWTQKRIEKLWNRLDRLGIRPERVQMEWISAAQGTKFASVMEELDRLRRTVTPEEIEAAKTILAAEFEKKAERLRKQRARMKSQREKEEVDVA
jgi:heterodisulfide reductase subunit A